jgi:hypothetical protein
MMSRFPTWPPQGAYEGRAMTVDRRMMSSATHEPRSGHDDPRISQR